MIHSRSTPEVKIDFVMAPSVRRSEDQGAAMLKQGFTNRFLHLRKIASLPNPDPHPCPTDQRRLRLLWSTPARSGPQGAMAVGAEALWLRVQGMSIGLDRCASSSAKFAAVHCSSSGGTPSMLLTGTPQQPGLYSP